MCERHGSQCGSLTSSVNWVNASLHAVFDSSLLPHADEKKYVTLFVCIFLVIIWPDVCARCSCIRKSVFLFYSLLCWGGQFC